MIHHNVSHTTMKIYHFKKRLRVPAPYGVSLASRVISKQTLLKKYSQVWTFLATSLHLSNKQREVVFLLLRFWCYYDNVYLKEQQTSTLAGCSKPTFWRTIQLLSSMNLIAVVNRYVRKEHAQISNAYIIDKLVLAIAKYLSERGYKARSAILKRLALMDGSLFWRTIYTANFTLAPPAPAAKGAITNV